MSIREIARLAGVSPSTVSRIVNSKNVSAASTQTQERIWAAVREVPAPESSFYIQECPADRAVPHPIPQTRRDGRRRWPPPARFFRKG